MVHAIDEKKKVIFNEEIKPTRGGLKEMIEKLGKQTKLVVFEAGNQLKWAALTLLKLPGVHTHAVHPNGIKRINQSSTKTDKIDAKKLAHLAQGDMLPREVHIVEEEARGLHELISTKHTQQCKRVTLINAMRGMLSSPRG